MSKFDFERYHVGAVFNPIRVSTSAEPVYQSVTVSFPSRLNAMALDPAGITANRNMVFTPGEILFAVDLNRSATVTLLDAPDAVQVDAAIRRPTLVKHAVSLVRQALGVNHGVHVEVDDSRELPHCGLGSSGGLIAAVAAATNEVYGRPIRTDVLNRYLAQNHGEEIDGDPDHLMPVQCIGGSGAAGFHRGGVLVLAGETTVIGRMDLGMDYRAVIGIPRDRSRLDAAALMELEIARFPRFLETGHRYGPQIAYRMLHEVLPSLAQGNLNPCGDLIFDYRFEMGSIDNCSFVHPRLLEIAARVRNLKERGIAEVVSLSLVGPAFFAITRAVEQCVQEFESAGLRCVEAALHDATYRVLTAS